MPSAAKKSAAYREGRADKSKKPSIEIEISTEGEEEEEGPDTEEMDGAKSPTNRKRSAKGAKNTKPPMDGGTYGKKPMDGEGCGCGGRKGKGTCDGNCGKKMDRNDALTPQEYLTACELGIQGRSRSYIRARLDAARRLDLKCGNGAISEGEKCTKGTATKAENKGPSVQQRIQSIWSGISAVGSGVAAAQNIGLAVKHRSLGHAVGALGNIGGAALNAKASSEYSKGRGISGNLYAFGAIGSNTAGAALGTAIAESDFRRRQANAVVNKPYDGPDPYKALGIGKNASVREARAAYMKVAAQHHPDRGGDVTKFRAAKQAYEELLRRNNGRRDSVWASGFAP